MSTCMRWTEPLRRPEALWAKREAVGSECACGDVGACDSGHVAACGEGARGCAHHLAARREGKTGGQTRAMDRAPHVRVIDGARSVKGRMADEGACVHEVSLGLGAAGISRGTRAIDGAWQCLQTRGSNPSTARRISATVRGARAVVDEVAARAERSARARSSRLCTLPAASRPK